MLRASGSLRDSLGGDSLGCFKSTPGELEVVVRLEIHPATRVKCQGRGRAGAQIIEASSGINHGKFSLGWSCYALELTNDGLIEQALSTPVANRP